MSKACRKRAIRGCAARWCKSPGCGCSISRNRHWRVGISRGSTAAPPRPARRWRSQHWRVSSSWLCGNMSAPASQGHIAQYQGQDATIYYPFHPCCGCRVAVVRRHPIRGVTMLVVEQPDGTMAMVPEWMTTPAAAAVRFAEAPRLPLSELRALRELVTTGLSLLSDRGNGGGYGISGSPRTAGAVSESGTNKVTAARGDAAATAPRRAASGGGGGLQSRRDGAGR
jgi:hypothetical protein